MKTTTKAFIKTACLSSLLIFTPSCDSDDQPASNSGNTGGDTTGGSDSQSDSLAPGDRLELVFEDETYNIEIIGGQLLNYSLTTDEDSFFVNGIPFTYTLDGTTITLDAPLTTISAAEALAELNRQLSDPNSAPSQAVANATSADSLTEQQAEEIIEAVNSANLGIILDYDGDNNIFVVTQTQLEGTLGGSGTLDIRGPVLSLQDDGTLVYADTTTGYTDSVTIQFATSSSQ